MKFLLSFPFVYFYSSRVKKPSGLLFTIVNEWIPAWAILVYLGADWMQALLQLTLGYFAFISLYEIGYIFNDHFSVRFEKNPRMRMGRERIRDYWLFLWIIIRVISALSIFIWQDWFQEPRILVPYGVLLIAFFLHNYLKNDQLKVFTFTNLALLRFFLPILPFLCPESLVNLLPGVIISHVLYRTISYANSKNLLNMPDREKGWFKVSFFSFAVLLSVAIWQMTASLLPVLICGYYLVVWSFFSFLSGKIRIGDS